MSVFKNNFVVGFTAAMAATIVAPVLIPALKRSGRPIAKSLVKGGLALYDKGREAVASAGEVIEDVIAEVRVEQVMQQASATNAHTHEEHAPPQNVSTPHWPHAEAMAAGRAMGNGGR